jgi:hypothetical protein
MANVPSVTIKNSQKEEGLAKIKYPAMKKSKKHLLNSSANAIKKLTKLEGSPTMREKDQKTKKKGSTNKSQVIKKIGK